MPGPRKQKVVFDQAKSDKLLADVKAMTTQRRMMREAESRDRMKRAVNAGKVGRFSNGIGVGY